MKIIKKYTTIEGCFLVEHAVKYSLQGMLDEMKTKPKRKDLNGMIALEEDFTIKDNGALYCFKFRD